MIALRTGRLAALVLALALVVGACGTDEPAELPTNDGGDVAAGACLIGDPDCDDMGVQPTDEPLLIGDEPAGDADPGTFVLGNGMSVQEATAQPIDGGFAITAWYLDDGSGARLCDGLLESFPPQCGEPSIAVDNSVGVQIDELRTEGSVTWSDQPATIVGEIVDGVFVVQQIDG